MNATASEGTKVAKKGVDLAQVAARREIANLEPSMAAEWGVLEMLVPENDGLGFWS